MIIQFKYKQKKLNFNNFFFNIKKGFCNAYLLCFPIHVNVVKCALLREGFEKFLVISMEFSRLAGPPPPLFGGFHGGYIFFLKTFP